MRAQQKLMLEVMRVKDHFRCLLILLQHLVVRKMKDEFKEGELDDILRYGAKVIHEKKEQKKDINFFYQELFAAEEGTEQKISKFHYDDDAIMKLLDR